MCGIFGYSGTKECNDMIFEGLKRLEYRGYDSWGIAILGKDKIYQYKDIGEIKEHDAFKKLPKGTVGIGHTRWATHGGVTKINTHPHISTRGDFTLVQNGIVENFAELKEKLIKKGVKFISQTDTEVIVRLIEEELDKMSLKEAIIHVFKKLEGRNTVAVLSHEDRKIYALRNGSPLVAGIAKDGIYLASDTLSFSPATNKAVLLENYDMVEIDGKDIEIFNILKNKKKKVEIKELKYQYNKIEKGKFDHFMIKEIVDQKETLLFATNYTEKDLEPLVKEIKKGKKVYLVGAGTAGFAAGQTAYFLRNIANIDAQEVKSYEFKSYLPIVKKGDIVIAFSQSGETADTIEAIEQMKEKGCKVASIVNMHATAMSMLSDFEYYTNSGPEICVASTKVFTAQCAWGYLLAMSIVGKYRTAKKNIKEVSKEIVKLFTEKSFKNIKDISNYMVKKDSAFILGKGENAFIALEGALKIKEISYKHVEGFAAGELKHGVIALIEKGTVVFGIIPSKESEDSADLISAMEQVKTRGAFTVGIGSKDFSKMEVFDRYVETPQVGNISSISNAIPFQLISYFLSVKLGNNVDRPRNLAKSVTVK